VGYLEDANLAVRPTATAHLYRGATLQRKRGMSWTRDLELAAWFAGQFSIDGHIWEAFVPPESILAHFHEARQVGRVRDQHTRYWGASTSNLGPVSNSSPPQCKLLRRASHASDHD
jgi:hypothetical protein